MNGRTKEEEEEEEEVEKERGKTGDTGAQSGVKYHL